MAPGAERELAQCQLWLLLFLLLFDLKISCSMCCFHNSWYL